MCKIIWSALVALMAWVPGTVAATLTNTHYGNWVIGAYSNESTGEFSHCAASAQYNSGIALVFSISRSYDWSLGFASAAWSLQPEANYPLDLSIDGVPVLSKDAVAISSDMAMLHLADSSALFELFRRGQILTVSGAGQRIPFALTDTAKILPRLLVCVRLQTETAESSVGNPFGGSKTSHTRNADRSVSHQAEAQSLLEGALARAGINNYSLLPAKIATSWRWTLLGQMGSSLERLASLTLAQLEPPRMQLR